MGRKRGSKSNGSKNNSSKNNSVNNKNNSNAVKANVKSNSEGSIIDKMSPIDMISWGFIIYMVSIYLFYMNKLYFDITHTRAIVFWAGAIIFVVLQIGSYIYDIYIEMKDPIKTALKKKVFIKDDKLFILPDFWMLIFLIANVVAYFNANNKTSAWTGNTGRFFGLKMILIIAIMFFVLSRRCYVNFVHYCVGAFMAVVAVLIAYLQHFGGDPLALREQIIDKQKELFISLFGNINTYGSFLAIAVPMVAAVFIFTNKKWIKGTAAAALIFISVGIIPAKSDNVYLGVGAAMLILIFVSLYYKRIVSFMLSCDCILLGLLFMAYKNQVGQGSQKHINGIAEIIESPKIMLILLVGFLVLTVIAFILDKKLLGKMEKKSLKRLVAVLIALLIILMAAFCVVGIKMKLSIFVFNDKWGTYRGYIWRRSVSLFGMASPWEKLFGYGNESISEYMTRFFQQEMIEVTNRTYDNSHNELLQYLVTTGLVGAISHVGLFVSGIAYLIRNAADDVAVIALMAGAAGYWVQGLVYLNQPITTPLYFVFLAAGIGYVRYKRFTAEEETD